MRDVLLEQWVALTNASRAARAVGEDLLQRWSEPHRTYHNVEHLAAVLGNIESLRSAARDIDTVRLAAFFHDAVYDRGGDDEERSAVFAESALVGLDVPAGTSAEVARLVRLTATHDAGTEDGNGAVLCDADLAVLAGTPADYAAYASAVRAEWPDLDDATFAQGRSAVLERLLARPALYATPDGRRRWEAAARHNLTTELGLLAIVGGAAGPPPAAD